MTDGGMLPVAARAEQGAAVLVMLLVLLVAAGGLFVSGFDADAARQARERADARALLRAKRALIARATLNPNRPGGLPCPDTDGDGIEELNCGEIGRLPWRTLDLPELRDRGGARLWYAVSRGFLNRAASEPLNSDVPGQLALDGAGGLAALLFAPGPPLDGQTGRGAAPNDVTQFLEGANAVADGRYSALASTTRNDVVLSVRVDEVMRDVHKRVAGVARDVLRRHLQRYAFDRYPWPAPFANPAASMLVGRAGVLQGHIPLHVAGRSFRSDYTVAWSIAGPGVRLDAGPNTLAPTALRENAQTVRAGVCFDAGGPPDRFDCAPAPATQRERLPRGVATRTFEFDLPAFVADTGRDIRPPTATRVGSRNVSVTNAVFAASRTWVIRVTDRDANGRLTGGGAITFDNVTAGDLAVNGIHLAPLIEPDGDHAWYLNNAWHALVYLSIAPGYAPGQPGSCMAGCLTLLHGPPPTDDKAALLLVAGAPLRGSRPSGLLADYFEGENADGDSVFETGFASAVFNDSVHVLASP